MRKIHLLTLLLAAALVAPTGALAHGGGQNNDKGHSRSSDDRRGSDRPGFSGSQHRNFNADGKGRFEARSNRDDDGKRHSKVQVKAAHEVSSEGGHHDKNVKGQHDSTPAPTPTATAAPQVRIVGIVGSFHLRGTVGSVADGSVVVNGQAIVIDPNKTKVKHGPLAAGQEVKIEGFLKSDGTFVAKQVKVKAGASASPEPSASPSTAPTSEPTVEPSPVLTPAVTPTADPSASPSPSPTPTATTTPEAQYIGSFNLRGKITAKDDDSIVVNGQTILITDDTKLKVKGGLEVGKTVSVKGGITTEGELVAKNVNRQNGFFGRFWDWCKGFWS